MFAVAETLMIERVGIPSGVQTYTRSSGTPQARQQSYIEPQNTDKSLSLRNRLKQELLRW
jgi:hypothetical protein